MKIAVRDGDTGNTLGAIQVRIKDLGGELERVAVRVFGLARRSQPTRHHVNGGDADRKQFQRSLFARMLAAAPGFSWTAPPAGTTAQPAVKTIEIKLLLPDWSKLVQATVKLWRWLLELPRKYQAVGVVLVLLLIVGVNHLMADKPGPPPHAAAAQADKPTTLTRGTPTFATVLPGGKSINSLGGWVRVSPPDHNAVYAFIDHISGVQISVSEQPLPKQFRSDTANQIAQLAEGFNATEKVTDRDGTIVYIGTSGKGPQSVILSKQQLLILIKSVSTLTNNQWVAYTSSLQ